MYFRTLLMIIACCFVGNLSATEKDGSYNLYLIRHAEKYQDGRQDPGLTKYGIGRAELLADLLADKDIKDVWSSDYKRTRETAEPLLSLLALEMSIYDARDLPVLAEKLMNRQNNAVVVGHSNTTPELARLLCQCDIDDMDDSEYDRLIVVSVTETGVQVETFRQRNPPKPWPTIAR